MKIAIILFGILTLLIGISLLINPEIIIGWIEANNETTALYISAIVARLVLGILFIAAAKESKYPGIIKILGYLFIIAATIFIFIGQGSFQNFIGSLIPDLKPYAPVSGLLSIVFGFFLMYAFLKKKVIMEN